MKSKYQWLAVLLGSVITTIAIAKLPAPVLTDEQKAKAEEAKAKAADAAKKEAADLGRYQDRVADRFYKEAKAAGKNPAAPQWVPPPPVVVQQPSSPEALGQKQTAVAKTQNTAATPAKAASEVKSAPTPAKKS